MAGPAAPPPSPLLEDLFRHHYGSMVAGLTRILGARHLDLVEDVVQEAMLRAMKVWPFQGIPEQPRAWLIRVARNLALDAVRRGAVLRRVEDELQHWAAPGGAPPPGGVVHDVPDDQLRMIFTCCHPALSLESRTALTLKTLCGFGIGEIASALLAKEATIAQRLGRARGHLRSDRVGFEVPAPRDLPDRLDGVLAVIYLVFNEGYRAHRGDDLVRPDLVLEAVRLARLLLEIPETAQPRVHALLALMLFLGARLPARTTGGGEPLTLALQDRARWDSSCIREGFAHFARSIDGPELTATHVEAAIASVHAAAPSYEQTDWPAILRRYDQLLLLRNSPIVRLNRAVAVAKVHGPATALRELDAIAEHRALRSYQLLPATRAQLHWSLGQHARAAELFREALQLPGTAPERQFLQRRLAACIAQEAAPLY